MSQDNAPLALWWIRYDFRLADNPALSEALSEATSSDLSIIPCYIYQDDDPHLRPMGGAGKWWLHQALFYLQEQLRQRNSRLILCRGRAHSILQRLISEYNIKLVVWNRCYDSREIERDRNIKSWLEQQGIKVLTYNSSLLVEPWTIKTQSGTPYKVYSQFWKKGLQGRYTPPPFQPAPQHLPAPKTWPDCDALAHWDLQPSKPDWAQGLRENWQIGEQAALNQLDLFLEENLAHYAHKRDIPEAAATSRLSPYLHWGHISPHHIWRKTQDHMAQYEGGLDRDGEKFLKELAWREFSYHLLYHFPHMIDQPLQEKFRAFPWQDHPEKLKLWQQGKTGYPLVDAGMRELWHTGWMHNRVRMVVASFLVKHLQIHWLVGEKWFWDTLVDADQANNSASWQWVAGSGADAAPYFRIFNPILQSEKFDPQGNYIRQWVPELAGLPDRFLHKPWQASEEVLAKADIVLGKTYPYPCVDHDQARKAALAAFQNLPDLADWKHDKQDMSGSL